MDLADVNVYIYAHRRDAEHHEAYRRWLVDLLESDRAFGVSDLVLGAVVRIVTNPSIYARPTPLEEAIAYADSIRGQENCVPIAPGPRHWEIFTRLCRDVGAKGGDVADAWFAALAIEHGCEWITADRGFARFPGLRWRHPLKGR